VIPEIPNLVRLELVELLDDLHREGLPLSMRQLLGYDEDQVAELLGWLDAVRWIRGQRGPMPLDQLPAPPDFVEESRTSPQGDGSG